MQKIRPHNTLLLQIEQIKTSRFIQPCSSQNLFFSFHETKSLPLHNIYLLRHPKYLPVAQGLNKHLSYNLYLPQYTNTQLQKNNM